MSDQPTPDTDPIPTPEHEPHIAPLKRRRWKRALFCALLLVLGFAAGYSVALTRIRSRINRFHRNPENMPQRMTEHMDRVVGLSDEQEAAILKVFTTHNENMMAIRRESGTKFRAEFEAINLEIQGILTPEQQAAWKTEQERIQKWMPRRPRKGDRRGKGEHDPGGPPPNMPPPPPPE